MVSAKGSVQLSANLWALRHGRQSRPLDSAISWLVHGTFFKDSQECIFVKLNASGLQNELNSLTKTLLSIPVGGRIVRVVRQLAVGIKCAE